MKVKEIFVTPKAIYMVMELIDGKELFDRIALMTKQYSENEARDQFR